MCNVYIVALGIDTTRAFRFPDEIVRLVEAVVAANSEDESTWIEWKGPLDLGSEPAFHRLPRNILGFANRDPAASAHHAEGYGYLIVGAEPGDVPGATLIDSGDLTARLRAYVGDKIVWHAQYVVVQGKQVLVIAVDPPRPGDSIHPLRKQMQNIAPGEVFIRLAGQTVKARAEHIEMLERRCKASANTLSISVSPVGGARIERPVDVAPVIEPRLALLRERLLAAAPKPPDPALESERFRFTIEFGRDAEAERAKDISAYMQDVEVFLDEWARAVTLRADLLQHGYDRSALVLKVTNNTDRNYLAVQVSAFVAGVGSNDLDGQRWPDLPAEPVPPSMARKVADGLLAGLANVWGEMPPRYAPPVLVPVPELSLPGPEPVREIPRPGGLLLRYADIDLRPRQEVRLQIVPLLVFADAGPAVSVRWEATAQNADGKISGEFAMALESSTLETAMLFSDGEDPDGPS